MQIYFTTVKPNEVDQISIRPDGTDITNSKGTIRLYPKDILFTKGNHTDTIDQVLEKLAKQPELMRLISIMRDQLLTYSDNEIIEGCAGQTTHEQITELLTQYTKEILS